MSEKWIYFFGDGSAEGSGDQKELLGGKGAGLAEMSGLGIPVPPGFTLTTEACIRYHANDRNYPAGLESQFAEHLHHLEELQGRKFGDPKDPLLLSKLYAYPLYLLRLHRPHRIVVFHPPPQRLSLSI